MTPLVGFLPDADPTIPGVIVDGDNLVPTFRGYRDAFVIEPQTAAFSGGLSRGAAFLRNLGNIPYTFVGTASALLYYGGNSWSDLSKSGGYNLVEPNRWSFRQFGNVSLASAIGTKIQASAGGAVFADVDSDAPQASYLAVSQGFVIAYRLSTQADGWHCSALQDHTDWTPSLATQSATNRFFDTPGPITGARELGESVVVFKERSMYWHRYVGVPVIWASECIDNEIGAICNEAIVDVGNALMFIGEHDIYIFDGTRPVPIGEGIREWFFSRLWWSQRWATRGAFDRERMLVYWWYQRAGSPSGLPEDAIVYNLRTRKWGHTSGYPVTDALSYAIDTGFVGIANRESLYVVNDSKLATFNPTGTTARIRLGWMGDDMISSTLTKLRPRFLKNPKEATVQFLRSDDMEAMTIAGSANLQEGAFGTKQNARWHSAELTLTGPFEMTAIGNDIPRPGGKR